MTLSGEPDSPSAGARLAAGARRSPVKLGVPRRVDALVVVREVLLVGALLLGYRAARLLTADEAAVGLRHARWLYESQQSLVPWADERHWQQVALAVPWLVKTANLYYAWVHFPLTGALLAFLLLRYRRSIYQRTRTALALATAMGLILHLAFPLAPPRMLSGFVDTAQAYGPSVYSEDTGGLVNQFAAMPSLHVGWAVIVALTLRDLRSHWLRVARLAHMITTALVVVVTGNHYWSDVLVGAAVAVAGWMLARSGWESRALRLCRSAAGSLTALFSSPAGGRARRGQSGDEGEVDYVPVRGVRPAVQSRESSSTGRRDTTELIRASESSRCEPPS